MRPALPIGGLLSLMLLLAACSTPAKDSAVLTLHDPYWERVNVQIVVTKLSDCDARGDGFVSTRDVVMRKGRTEEIEVPNGASLCWRHDRNPNNPSPGAWSGWTRATLFPGQSADSDL